MKMCCWGYEDVYLEDPPPPKKKPEPDNHEYVLMSSDAPKPAEAPVAAPVSHVHMNLASALDSTFTLICLTHHNYLTPRTCDSFNINSLLTSSAHTASNRMVQYYDYPYGEAPQAARPKNAWELIRDARDEAARNAEIPGFEPAPSQSAGQVVAQRATGHQTVPAPLTPGYYYCYSVLQHTVNYKFGQSANTSQQPVYAPPPAMQYVAQPNAYVGHQMLYHPALAPAKIEEKKADPGPSPYGNPKTEFWCRELDGSWQLRTLSDIMKNCQPAYYQTHEVSGWPVYYRQTPK